MGGCTISVNVTRIPTKGPGDVSGLMALIPAGIVDPATILAVLGNGGVNDFTREYPSRRCARHFRRISILPRERSRTGSPSSCRGN